MLIAKVWLSETIYESISYLFNLSFYKNLSKSIILGVKDIFSYIPFTTDVEIPNLPKLGYILNR